MRHTRTFLAAAFLLLFASLSLSAQDPSTSSGQATNRKEAEARIKALEARVGELYGAGKYSDARSLAEEAVKVAEEALGESDPGTAAALNNLAEVLQKAGDLNGAKPLFERALAIDEKTLGPDHPETAVALSNLANVRQALGDVKGAKPLYERALAIDERVLGPNQPQTAIILDNLAQVLYLMGDLKGARPLLERALAICEKALGPDHWQTAQNLNDLAQVLYVMGDLKGARPLLERALAVYERALGPDHPDTAMIRNNLAGLLQALGDLKGAKPLYERALAIDEKVLGPNHPQTAVILDNLAQVLYAMGDLEGARPLCERALAIREKALGPDRPETATSLSDLAILLRAMGDLKAAKPLLERALAIDEKSLGPDHTETATAVDNLAQVLYFMGDLKGAKPLFERALASRQRALGPEHPDTATTLNDLATVLRAMGDLEGAKSLYERALAISEKALGPDHERMAASLNNLAQVLQAMGDVRGAKPLLERALAIRKKALGPDHPHTAEALNNLAAALQAMGDLKGAKEHYAQAWEVNRSQLLSLLPALSSRERCAMVHEKSLRLGYYLAGFADEPEKTYDAALVWKGAAMRASAGAQRLPADAPADACKIADALAEARRTLAKLALSPPTPKEGERSIAEQYHAAREDVEKLERSLARMLPEYAAKALHETTIDEVRKALPQGAALLDLLQNGETLHAWVVRREGDIAYFNLGRADDLAPLVERFRTALEQDDEKQWKEAGAALRERLKAPLSAALAGASEPAASGRPQPRVERLYISPDGVLATIPWGLLPEGEGYLIESVPITCVCVAGARGASPSAEGPSTGLGQGLLSIGDVDYERAEGATGKAARWERQAPALPATRQEAEQVAKRFAERFPKAPCHTLTGGIATVARFEKLAPSARYVHVATHGFFDTEHLAVALGANTRGINGMMSAPIQQTLRSPGENSIGSWNPLLLSGIVMAGANAGDGGGGSDGLLTAEELQGLDLSGTELVVLSACETGRGELAAGEGVMGLSRALFIAGARGFMLSLWRVPDAETRELMDGFYAGLWDESLTAEEALRATQLRMLLRDRESKRFRPSSWGAWVLIR